MGDEWNPAFADDYGEETKRFVAVLLDNVRTLAERRYHLMAGKHRDWIGVYTRENSTAKRFLDESEVP